MNLEDAEHVENVWTFSFVSLVLYFIFKTMHKLLLSDPFEKKTIRNETPCTFKRDPARSDVILNITAKHLASKQKPKKCDVCGKTFINNFELKRHVETVHEGIKPTCNICGKEFSFRHSLIKHFKAQHPGEKRPPSIKYKSYNQQ